MATVVRHKEGGVIFSLPSFSGRQVQRSLGKRFEFTGVSRLRHVCWGGKKQKKQKVMSITFASFRPFEDLKEKK